MPSSPEYRETLARLRRLRLPRDYFSEARSGPDLWPERILCFTRKGRSEIEVEPLARHHHHRYVLIVPWIGKGDIHVEEKRFLLFPGHALLILPFQFHYRLCIQSDPILWQFITFELRSPAPFEPMRSDPLRRLEAGTSAALSSFVRSWTDTVPREGEPASWLSLVLSRLRQAPLSVRSGGGTRAPVVSRVSLVARINREFLPRVQEISGLKDLARRMGISESHLRASFRQETGISLGRHVRRLRLQKAMGLLAQSELSITQIAERCGFDTVFTFSRSFSHFAGVSAREYRKRYLR